MITREYPYDHDDEKELDKLILQGNLTFPDFVKDEPKDLISKLMLVDRQKRMGRNGSAEVRAHPWMQDVEWDKLEKFELKPPYIPPMAHPGDGSNFRNKEAKNETEIGDPFGETFDGY